MEPQSQSDQQFKSFEDMTPIEQVVHGLTAVRKGILDILKAPEHQVFAIRADSDLKRLQAFLQNATGTVVFEGQADNIQNLINAFGPVTTFMGHEIDRPQPVNFDNIDPSEADRQAFLAKRDALYDRITEMSDEQLQAYLLEPKSETVLRSVAKKAGLYNFREDEINAEFFANIRVAIVGQKERERHTAEAEDLKSKMQAAGGVVGDTNTTDTVVDEGKRLEEQQRQLDEAAQRQAEEEAKAKELPTENKGKGRGGKS
jgi:hypothetical protein